MNVEQGRLSEADDGTLPWRLWGPYLSERQWGTVREDYPVEWPGPHPQGAPVRAQQRAG
jgi:hypothetical protein